MRAFLTFTVLLLVIAEAYSENSSCPKVFDGLTNGHFDLSTQFSTKEISGNWAGLDKEQVIGYEWAIVSENLIKANSLFFKNECRKTSGFLHRPDIKSWEDVRKETSATAINLSLTPGVTYYVVVRTTLANGTHVYSNSDGILILSQELQLEGAHSSKVDVDDSKNMKQARSLEEVNNDCSLDQANQCAGAQISVREILAQLYGPPVFPGLAAAPVLADDDDDDATRAGGVILAIITGFLIAMLCLLCFCFLLAALAAIFWKKIDNSHDDDHKFNESVQVNETEHVDADYGTTVEHTLADDTRVEFPDYDPKTRLSVAN